jgi:hypothetical protein
LRSASDVSQADARHGVGDGGAELLAVFVVDKDLVLASLWLKTDHLEDLAAENGFLAKWAFVKADVVIVDFQQLSLVGDAANVGDFDSEFAAVGIAELAALELELDAVGFGGFTDGVLDAVDSLLGMGY